LVRLAQTSTPEQTPMSTTDGALQTTYPRRKRNRQTETSNRSN